MKKQIFLIAALVASNCIFAQKDKTDNLDYQSDKNIVKVSLTSLAFKNFQFQYERALNKTFSLGMAYSFIPEGAVPLKSMIESYADDPDLTDILNDVTISYRSFTPEVRMYLGKGFGKGFYFAPFYRNSKYTIDNFNVEYESDTGQTRTLSTNGNISTNTFGLLLGTQFNIGKHMVLDWWIVGPHYGSSKGDLIGVSSQPLSITEQQVLLNELQDIEIPLTETAVEVDANGGTIKMDGPWGGIKSGLSLGYRF